MSTLAKIFAALLLATPLAWAQTPAAAPPPKEPEYVTTRDFKSKILTVQHRDLRQLRDMLLPLCSGFRGASLAAVEGDGLKTLSVRDFPENILAIEEALKPSRPSRKWNSISTCCSPPRLPAPAKACPRN